MKEYKKHKVYFFDYLWWLGEKAQEHYQGQPRRPDGEAMFTGYIIFFVMMPLMFLLLHLGVFRLYAIALVISLGLIWAFWLPRKIWPPHRQRAIMEHYAGRKFSPLRAYAALYFPVAAFGGLMIIQINIIEAKKQKEQAVRKVDPETTRRLLKQMQADTTYTHHPWYNGIGRKRP
ncbi:MAG: hypothetical protein K2M96_09480 [Prevotella sp.]|nr:hypothetical protein [Prevotella sp.]